MKKTTFNLAIRNGKGTIAKEVSGYVYLVAGSHIGIHGENGYWNATDLLTGFKVGEGKTIVKAVEDATRKREAIAQGREYIKANNKDILSVIAYNPDKYKDCTYQMLTVKPFTQEV